MDSYTYIIIQDTFQYLSFYLILTLWFKGLKVAKSFVSVLKIDWNECVASKDPVEPCQENLTVNMIFN